MKVLVTGSNGFIGKNLCLHLLERNDLEIAHFTSANNISDLYKLLEGVDLVFHLAGVNRPDTSLGFSTGNIQLTDALVQAVEHSMMLNDCQIPIVFTSSSQATLPNDYGFSKVQAESILKSFTERTGAPTYIFRLPNVFGKFSRPNYNSVVATFCYNISRDLPIQITSGETTLQLLYVDDLVKTFLNLIESIEPSKDSEGFCQSSPIYTTSVDDLARLINSFYSSRETLLSENVGLGFTRALYSTYLSFLPPESFAYNVDKYEDFRGVFVEILKTPSCGQISYFTAHSGMTRGGHYHHTKSEKFLVIVGDALFRFKHLVSGDYYEIYAHGGDGKIIESIPGWSHDITNIGSQDLVVFLWANEIYDQNLPDTYYCPLSRT